MSFLVALMGELQEELDREHPADVLTVRIHADEAGNFVHCTAISIANRLLLTDRMYSEHLPVPLRASVEETARAIMSRARDHFTA